MNTLNLLSLLNSMPRFKRLALWEVITVESSHEIIPRNLKVRAALSNVTEPDSWPEMLNLLLQLDNLAFLVVLFNFHNTE